MNLERELKRIIRQIRPGLIGATSNPNVNLAQAIEELKTTPDRLKQMRETMQTLLAGRDFTKALTETGLTLEAGVFTEIYKRLEYKLLPKSIDGLDILSFISHIFDSQADAAWLEKIDRERFGELLELLIPEHEKLIEPLASQVFMSLEILSLRLAGLGYDPVVSHRLRSRRDFQHAFMEVTRRVHSLLDGRGDAAIPEIREALDRCAQSVRWIRSRRGVEGASLALTYRLMKIQQMVERMRLILELIDAMLGTWTPKPARELFFTVVLSEIRRFDLSRFFARNVELLAYQITEHTGKAGEHYITRTKSEWGAMFRSAALGGVMVAVMAILKVLGAKLHLPPGPEFLLFGTLYAVGFLLILWAGATLATKQPAMTASTLASALDDAKSGDQAMENLSEIIVRTIRSQMAALLGNFLIAFPAAAFFCLPFNMMKAPLMSPEKAWATIESLHGLYTLSFFYAAVAGVCLFTAGILAGFADNWFVFNHVGSRLRQSELLRRAVGGHNLDRAIHGIDHNLGFWVGNVSLGFLLAAMPAIGVIFGLPLDVRHITLSTASFGAAAASLNFQIPVSLAVWVAASLFIMGLINLATSFSLSLFLAIKSRRIKFSQTPQLLALLGRRLRQRPLEFLLPLRDPP